MAEFDAILQQSLDSAILFMIVFVGGLLVLGIAFAVGLFFICKRLRTEDMDNRDYERLKKKRRTLIFSLCLIVGGMVAVSIGSVQKMTHLKNDMDRQQYICVEADYSYTLNGKNEKTVTITYDGKTVYVNLPQNRAEDDFPLGQFHGTAWYSKESRILLDFAPDEE